MVSPVDSKMESFRRCSQDVTDSIIPGLTHWQSPNFFAYFQANASTAGFVGEMLCTGLNKWRWCLHGSTCEAIVCTLVAARDRTLRNIGAENIAKLVVYASDQTHSTLLKGVKLVGIPSSNFRCLSTSFSSEFSLSPQLLEDAIENDIKAGYVPLFLCATVGTTALKYNLWFHIDAAYAGSACICPEFRHYLDGIELADSLSMNPHKWLLTNMDCCCFGLQRLQIALSRRFRALKLWIVIRRHGIANLMFHIRSHVNLAKRFESLVAKDSRFELKHNDACKASELNRKLLAAVNESGRAFMTHSVVVCLFIIRFVDLLD
uniref:Tyrosine decarboxylase n=1 Tax=Salix viminalis TaxID=40686 RepID=A0A6N2NFR7_SALVM